MEEKYQKMGTYLLKEHLKLSLSCNQKKLMLFSRRGTRMPEKNINLTARHSQIRVIFDDIDLGAA
jgi:hypothetical protein